MIKIDHISSVGVSTMRLQLPAKHLFTNSILIFFFFSFSHLWDFRYATTMDRVWAAWKHISNQKYSE